MIRKNLSGDLPVIHESAYVDNTAIICGKVVIGFNSVLFNCSVGDRSVVRHNSVVEGCRIPPGFYIPSTSNIHSDSELADIAQVTPQVADFSESVALANHELVKGYKKLQNEF